MSEIYHYCPNGKKVRKFPRIVCSLCMNHENAVDFEVEIPKPQLNEERLREIIDEIGDPTYFLKDTYMIDINKLIKKIQENWHEIAEGERKSQY